MDTKIISTNFSKGQLSALGGAQDQRVVELNTRRITPVEKRPSPEQVSELAAQQAASNKPIEQVVETLNTQSLSSNRTLKFSIDDTLGKPVISVVDKETNEIIRQIPEESAIKIAEAFAALATGSLLSESA